VTCLSVAVFLNHAGHLILQIQFLLLEVDLLELLVVAHVIPVAQLPQLAFVSAMFLGYALELLIT
jgi:hypothetical protein